MKRTLQQVERWRRKDMSIHSSPAMIVLNGRLRHVPVPNSEGERMVTEMKVGVGRLHRFVLLNGGRERLPGIQTTSHPPELTATELMSCLLVEVCVWGCGKRQEGVEASPQRREEAGRSPEMLEMSQRLSSSARWLPVLFLFRQRRATAGGSAMLQASRLPLRPCITGRTAQSRLC